MRAERRKNEHIQCTVHIHIHFKIMWEVYVIRVCQRIIDNEWNKMGLHKDLQPDNK